MIAPDRAHLTGPAVRDAEHPFAFDLADPHRGLRVEHHRLDAKERVRRRARFRRRRPRQRRDHMPAGLGLPERVHDRTFPFSNIFVVPDPGLGVDRLAHRAQHAKAGKVIFLNPFRALTHQRADRRRRGVELVDLVLFAHGPEPPRIGPGRHALEHQRRRAIRQRPVDDVAVPRHPAHIGGAPEHIAVLVVEGVLMRHRGIDEVAPRRVHDPLRLAGRARGVKDEERIFRIHRPRRAFRADVFHQVKQVDVAAMHPGNLIAGVLDDQAAHLVRAVQQGGIGVRFQRRAAAATRRGIGGDDELGAAIIDPVRQRIGREARENNGVDGADAGAGEHRIGGFRDHRQIDHDPVAAHDALRKQHVRHPVHLFGQLLVGDVLGRFLRIIGFEDDRGLQRAVAQVAVDAVHRGVQNAILEPFDRDLAEGEIGVLDLGIGRDPVQPLAFAAPERIRVLDRFPIHLKVFRAIRMRSLKPRGNIPHLGGCDHLFLLTHLSLPL